MTAAQQQQTDPRLQLSPQLLAYYAERRAQLEAVPSNVIRSEGTTITVVQRSGQ